MRKAKVLVNGCLAGYLVEHERGKRYSFSYLEDYSGPPVSLTMPRDEDFYEYDHFPPFFEENHHILHLMILSSFWGVVYRALYGCRI